MLLTTFIQQSTPAPPAAQTDEEKKAERLAKLEAWKQKQAAERERKQKELAAAGGARHILDQIDQKSAPTPEEPSAPVSQSEDAAPAAYAGKFDPKAIAKKATETTTGPSVLGDDAAVPSKKKATETEANKASAPTTAPTGEFSFLHKSSLYFDRTSAKCFYVFQRHP